MGELSESKNRKNKSLDLQTSGFAGGESTESAEDSNRRTARDTSLRHASASLIGCVRRKTNNRKAEEAERPTAPYRYPARKAKVKTRQRREAKRGGVRGKAEALRL